MLVGEREFDGCGCCGSAVAGCGRFEREMAGC